MKTFYELIDVNDYEIRRDEMVPKVLFLKLMVLFSPQVVLFLSNGYIQSNPRLTHKSTYTP